MIIALMGGGPKDHVPDLDEIKGLPAETRWGGIDRGVLTLFEYGIFPEVAVGDFDSVLEDEMQLIDQNVRNLHTVSAEKDETDMELALNWAMEQNPSHIYIFGATGKRQDHQLANIYLLLTVKKQRPQCHVEIVDRWNHISIYTPGQYQLEKNELPYISFLPVTMDVDGLTLTGFKYPLKDSHIFLGSTLCISNELIESTGTFSFNNGILLMIRSRD